MELGKSILCPRYSKLVILMATSCFFLVIINTVQAMDLDPNKIKTKIEEQEAKLEELQKKALEELRENKDIPLCTGICFVSECNAYETISYPTFKGTTNDICPDFIDDENN